MFGRAAQIEIPTTLEYAWHFPMKTAMRLYIGAGVGAFYHKVYRSVDRSHFDSATIFKLGADTPLDRRSLLGVDLRFASVSGDDRTPDPVFGREEVGSKRWSVKLNYARVF